MSGIYIPMEMPKSCYKCPLKRREGMNIVCPVAHEMFSVADVNILDYRLDNCPIIPVPDHGGLVDLKAPFCAQYYDEMTEEWVEKEVTVEDVLFDSMVYDMPPVVIPADKEPTR